MEAVMLSHNPPYLFAIAREEKEETNLSYHETRHGEN
jgi:hypothetical protein